MSRCERGVTVTRRGPNAPAIPQHSDSTTRAASHKCNPPSRGIDHATRTEHRHPATSHTPSKLSAKLTRTCAAMSIEVQRQIKENSTVCGSQFVSLIVGSRRSSLRCSGV